MKYEHRKTLEVVVTGHVETRKAMEKRGFLGMGDNNRKYRAVVNHPNGRIEWQWCETLKEAKQWVKSTIGAYVLHGKDFE